MRWLALLSVLICLPVWADKLPKLVLAGPFASVSNPLIHMVESGALNGLADKVEFVAWKDPDQLRILALEGKADFIAMPTNVAANLHNKGVNLQLLNVSTWGVLWMISRDPTLKTLADFKGKEIAMPFRADMPDIVFSLLAEAQGINPNKDMKLRYVASPLDAMQLLIMRRVDHALLAEPAASMALRKTKSFPLSVIAPELHRSIDLQAEWGRVFATESRVPQAGITVMGSLKNNPQLIEQFQQAYANSLAWCQQNSSQCGELVAKRVDMLTPEAVADSMATSQMAFVTSKDAKPALTSFYQRLLTKEPALLGGKLPADSFYYDGSVQK